MGIAIYVFTRSSEIRLECDIANEFFCCGFETFQSPDGFVGCHKLAMKAGWLERQSSDGRQWLCPRCSGKIT